MKKLYSLLAFAFSVLVSNAQIVTIPDANFKAKLLAASPSNSIAKNLSGNYFKIDANNDGEIQTSEALEVKNLDVGLNYGAPNYLKMTNMIGIEYFINLWELKCGYHLLTSLNIDNITSLRYLECTSNQISVLNLSLLNNLNTLICTNNQISVLDLTNLNQLEILDCGNNNISSLDTTGLTLLKYLTCYNNNLSSINVNNCTSLIGLRCHGNSLTSLSFDNLIYLSSIDCQSNSLTSLNLSNLPSLSSLNLANNQVSSLDLSPFTTLTSLVCNDNSFSNLDLSNLVNLGYLSYGNDQLNTVSLNTLTNLNTLRIYDSTQTSLDISNSPNITNLHLVNINITTLDLSNFHSLNSLWLSNLTYLGYVNTKNGNPLVMSFTENYCSNLDYICANDEDLLEIINEVEDTVQVNSYCYFNPGGDYNTISGVVHYDSNFDGCTHTDPTFNGIRIGISDGLTSGATFSTISGSYFFFVQEPNITLTPSFENPSYFTVSPSPITLNFGTNNNTTQTQNFCMERNGIHNDLEVILIPTSSARPGFDATYKIIYKNKGTDTQSGTINFTYEDSILQLVSANPNVSSQGTDSLNWTFTNLLPFESREITMIVNVNSPTDTPAVNGGHVLNYTATITGATDETPNDNSSTLNQTVVNSFDPNDKTCIEGTTITPSMVGQYVHYVIRFENTGSTNAENIVVKDMIDTTKFDIASLIPQSSSHPFITRITNTNKVEFIFENINLPFDDANNDGYVAFKIKTKPTLVVGNTFSNNASIYFDYNFPIVTNTYSTTVQALNNQDFEFSSVFSLSPVPVKDWLTITTKETVTMTSISIYNTLGQLIQVNTNPNETIDVSGLQSGSYFIKIISDKGSSSSKFIKE